MGYTLHNRPGSGGFAIEAALTWAGIPFTLIELDSRAGTPLPENFREINPWGQLPTLILPDGTTMTETSAILVHLASCFPDKHLGPRPGTPAHAAFLRWMIFANVNLYEAVVRSAYPFRFTDDPAGYDALRSAATRRMGEAMTLIDTNVVEPFLLGHEMTVADIYIVMFTAWYRGDLQVSRIDRIAEAVRCHPAVGPIWQRHFCE